MKKKTQLRSVISVIILFSLFLISMIPVVVMFIRSWKTLPQVGRSQIFPTLPLHYGNYLMAWELVSRYLVNTVTIVVLAVVGVIFLSSITAYVFARYDFPGKNGLFALLIALLMIPGVIGFVPSIILVLKHMSLSNNILGVLFPYWAGGQIFAVYVLRTFFEGLPEEMYEAARLDGASHLGLYWRITMPLSGSILSVIAILNIISTWNDYVWPLIVLADEKRRTIAVGLTFLRDTKHPDPGTEMAAYVIASIPMLVLFLATMKTFVRGITAGAIKA
ncbi:MAG: carbohydrate ABC transporter permease [Chloroflexi bacterium]|jgi:ABC-type glycerol-3-phosphate transport system permease component|nr:carbohydrate ABC transporter permease [Chloroflexota bacterium]